MRKFRWIQYDLSMFVTGAIAASTICGSFLLTRQLMIPPQAPDSVAYALSAGTDKNYTMYIKVLTAADNYATSAVIGTVYFAQNSKNGVISIPQGINLLQGDMLQVYTDNVIPSNGLKDITLVLLGYSILRT